MVPWPHRDRLAWGEASLPRVNGVVRLCLSAEAPVVLDLVRADAALKLEAALARDSAAAVPASALTVQDELDVGGAGKLEDFNAVHGSLRFVVLFRDRFRSNDRQNLETRSHIPDNLDKSI